MPTVPVKPEPVLDESLTAEMLWAEVHGVINENSKPIAWLYIAGLLLFSVRLLLQYRHSQQLKTRDLLPATDEWYGLLASTMERLNISRPIHIAFTERKISPCIIGHAKAVILIPISLTNHLTTEQAEAILLHELAHYKQYDHYINLGVQCVKCILFFNPFVWLTAVLIDKYRELSCDETATKHERNIELAETLALIAGMHTRQNSLVMSLKKNNPLLARVQALLSIRQYDKSSHRLLPAIVTTIILATGLLIAGSTKLFSTEKDSLREQLKEISAQMYKEGNHKYIFVDAVLDSLITLPTKADVLYMGSQYFSMTGSEGQVKMTTQQRERYIKKLQLFLLSVDEDKEAPVIFDAIKGKGTLTVQEILNKESTFRTYTTEERYRAGIAKQGWKKVFAELVKDKLVQPGNKNFSMEYSNDGIVINGWELQGAQDTKYRRMLKEAVGIDLNAVSGSLSNDDMQSYLGLTGKNNIEDINTLAEVSRLLFAEGKIEYILADAMKDGYLEDGNKFTLVMNGDELRFAGVKMSKEHEAQYNDKYRLFKEYYICPDCHGSVSETIRYSDLTNQNSALRKGDFLLTVNSNLRHEKIMQLFSELQKDGLADTNHRTEIEYRNGQVFLNLIQLETEVSEKYVGFMKKIISHSGKVDSFGNYIWYIDKPFPQYYYDRLNRFTEKEMLQHVSDELFSKGDMHYVLVDAVIDGTLKDRSEYDLKVDNGIVRFKGHPWPSDKQAQYSNKLALCKKANKGKGRFYSSMLGTIHLDEILDPNSEFRNPLIYADPEIDGKPFTEYIMTEMQKDDLIDRAYQVRIIYTDSTIIVNNKKLVGELHRKYDELYKKTYPNCGKSFSNSLMCNTDQPFPPDKNTGLGLQEQQRLKELSEDLFRNGHQGFIIAELVKDGYIKKGDHYKVSYKNGKFSMVGKSLPPEVIKTYEAKMAKFTAAHPSTATVWWSLDDTYEATNTADEFNMKLSGATQSDREKEAKEKEREANFWKFMQALHKDGLLDTNSYYLVEYKKDGLYVNAIKLTGSKEKKYTEWLNALGYTAGKGMRTERVPDGVKIPDRRIGNSVMSMPVHGNNLPAIAQLMFVDGNPNFILAHALHDGALREGQRYDIRYVRGKVYSKGELLAEPWQSKYARLITDFTRAHDKPAGSYAVHGDGVTKKELNTPGSAIRRDVIRKGQGIDAGKVVGKVIGMMATDGVVDTTKRFTLQYNAKGLFVNNKKLTGKDAQKYEEALNKELDNNSRITTFNEINYEHNPW